jgi:hypothetical protein
MWLALMAGAALLVSCGVFFAVQGLGRADQYASVGSFFLALLTAAGAMFSLARSKSADKSADDAKVNQRSPRHLTLNLPLGNDTVLLGDRTVVEITKIVNESSRKGDT